MLKGMMMRIGEGIAGNGNGGRKWTAKIIEWGLVAVIAVIGFYVSVKATIDTTAELKPMVFDHEKKIIVITEQYKNIEKWMERIDKKLDK